MIKSSVMFLLAALVLGACNQHSTGPKQDVGTLLGAGVGALAGSQVGGGKGKLAAVAIGALLGGYAGNEIGKSLDRADKLAATQAARKAQTAPIGQTINWNNPESGNSGTVTPTRQGTNSATGAYCREFRQTVTIGGQTQEAFGRACRQPDGSWKIVQ
ncbi:MAG: hypothetical protein CMP14_02445 [Rickettsiales bacterium]|jgi:surface antigen|nr:hypothetical protein [Rickettsiales bacterium]